MKPITQRITLRVPITFTADERNTLARRGITTQAQIEQFVTSMAHAAIVDYKANDDDNATEGRYSDQ